MGQSTPVPHLEEPGDEIDCITTSSSSGAQPVVFARFEGGHIKLFPSSTTETEYIAISHVWGVTEWLHIGNVEGKRKISRSKAKFVKSNLEALVGKTAFWMDTLTVNQEDPEEVIAIVQMIPTIFRDAIRTIAIRENDGFYDCCAEAVRGFKDWEDFQQKMIDHNHPGSPHEWHIRTESYLQRLWTLQECLLSHTIQFVIPRPNQPRKLRKEDRSRYDWSTRQIVEAERLLDSLYVLAYSFIGDQGRDGIQNFLRAYIDGGTIARTKKVERSETEDIYTDNFRLMHSASNRAATEPRDYIFATMPQFPWYRYPHDAEQMSFGDIFLDLHEKASRARHSFACKFTRSMTDPEVSVKGVEAWLPSKEQPDPECLGDFLKLFGQEMPDLKPGELNPIHLTKKVAVIEDLKVLDESPEELLEILEAAMRFSKASWSESHRGGELSKYGSSPDDEWVIDSLDAARSGFIRKDSLIDEVLKLQERKLIVVRSRGEYVDDESISSGYLVSVEEADPTYVTLLEQSRKILDVMWRGDDWKSFKRDMQGKWSRPLLRTTVLLAAMVGCEVGLSAATWIRKRFVPVLVHYGDGKKGLILGLLAKHACKNSQDTQVRVMYSVGRHLNSHHQKGFCQDLVIVDPETKVPVGILPDFLPHVRSDELFIERATMLYESVKSENIPSQAGEKPTIAFGYVSLKDV